MKTNILGFAIALLLFTSCSSQLQVGKINMISNRNIDYSRTYVNLSSYTNGTKKDLRKSKFKTIEAAIDYTVKKVPGGEYLMNARIWLIDGSYYAVEGDVWGIEQEQNFKGFKVGDQVLWKSAGKFYVSEITSLKDTKECIIKVETTGKLKEVKYSELSKLE